MCNDREERTSLGLCMPCREELHAEHLVPPGKQLHATGTLPEDVGAYRVPLAHEYRTTPT